MNISILHTNFHRYSRSLIHINSVYVSSEICMYLHIYRKFIMCKKDSKICELFLEFLVLFVFNNASRHRKNLKSIHPNISLFLPP